MFKSKTITISLEDYERLVKDAADVRVWKERGDRYAAHNAKLEESLTEYNKQGISTLKEALSLLKKEENHDHKKQN